jgi:DNA-binding transcriptional LysR family regulator
VELRQLRYFVAVAEEGGFGRASERLSIVQSAVSQQVRHRERRLGVALFDRSSRRVRLTAAGERLLPEARAVLAAADRTRRIAADIAAGDSDVLRLGTVQGPGDRMYRMLTELAAVAPGLHVRPHRLSAANRLAAVRSGDLDAALVRAARPAKDLNLLHVWTDPLYVAVPVDHQVPSGRTVCLEDLADLPLRLAPRDANAPFHDLITDSLRSRGSEPLLGPPFNTLQQTLTAIAAGPPTWTVFYDVSGLPSIPGIAVHRLANPTLTTSLAVPQGPVSAGVQHLLTALNRMAQKDSPHNLHADALQTEQPVEHEDDQPLTGR